MTPETIDLNDNITLVDAQYQVPGLAATYIVREGDAAAIIETGTTHTVPMLLAALEQRGLSREQVQYVIPTHVHLDHACGAGALIAQCPNARLVIHPRGARHMIDPSKLVAGTIAVYGEEKFHALYGDLVPVPEERVIEAPDNFEVALNGRILRFLDTPGHALHHFCVHDLGSNGVFTGDTFGLSYPNLATPGGAFVFATTTPVQFDPDQLRASIERLMALGADYFYLTHYGRIEASRELADQLLTTIEDFVNIALQEKKTPKRVEVMASRILDYLVAGLETMECDCAEDDCRDWLAMDAGLNAQGLDVWLKRLDRNAA
ncbi:MAG: MBL fold metallo-hydrolase [Gammaproteobacteria bacterium]|jgi:glyoxylase-like metal-dependent hydrolase (beta-lactamase superfamily II)